MTAVSPEASRQAVVEALSEAVGADGLAGASAGQQPRRPGDRVLLAAFPALDALAAYSFAVVDQALRAHAPVPGEGRRP